MTADDEVRQLLRSPALGLQPAAALAERTRQRARAVRRRQRGVALAAVLVLGGAGWLLTPAVRDVGHRLTTDQPAAKADPRFPDATSAVVSLATMNGAELVTWFEGAQWCTATTRVTGSRTCRGPARAQTRDAIPFVLGAGSASLTVDDRHLVAGLMSSAVTRVVVHLSDGRDLPTSVFEGRGFPLRAWAVEVHDDPRLVEAYVAYDASGAELSRRRA